MFTMYNGRMDPVEHVSHFNQKIAVHSRNRALMCKVFTSSLGPMAMRWFDGLDEGSINSFRELTRAFRARSVTYNKVPHPLDSLLSMTMTERKKKELGNLELKHLYKSKRNTHTHTHIYIYIYISKYTFLGLDRGVFFLSNLHVLIIFV